jgi:hypothetical protein
MLTEPEKMDKFLPHSSIVYELRQVSASIAWSSHLLVTDKWNHIRHPAPQGKDLI